MELYEFIKKVRQNPALEQVWKKTARAALKGCASSDEALLSGKPMPKTDEFDQAWAELKKEAAKQGIVFEGKVFPHDVTQIIAK